MSEVNKNRRPIAEPLRWFAHRAVDYCVRRGVHPDAISWFSIVPAAAAGACFATARFASILWIVGAGLCIVRLWFNMLDGMVAIAAGKTSKKGAVVNELPDRISDVVIFVGLAHCDRQPILAGYWAAIAAVMTAYIGILGQTVGAPRRFEGPMSKPWRMVVVVLVAFVAFGYGFVKPTTSNLQASQVVRLGCWIVVAGSVPTMVTRYRRTTRWLDDEAKATHRA